MFSLSVHIISVFALSLIFILEKKDELREAAVAYPYPDIKFLLISFTSMEACTAHLQCMFQKNWAALYSCGFLSRTRYFQLYFFLFD